MKMTIKEFFESKDRLAIHCNTEEKAKKLLEAFDKAGHCWVTGSRYIEDISWELDEEETCYSNTGCCGSTNYLKECRYTILEFEEIELEDASLKSKDGGKIMTRKEAIEALAQCVDWAEHTGRRYVDTVPADALKMALEALEALEQIKAIEGIIDVSNITIQEDVIKYKMIVDVVKGG